MIHLKNATFIHWDTLEFRQTDIWVDEGEAGGLSFSRPVNTGGPVEELDCSGMLVTRSLVNAHHHIYSALARGMPMTGTHPRNFHEKLKYLWWKLDDALDAEMIRYSALATAIAAARSGCSFIIDHHSSPSYIRGSLDIIANALDEAGLGHLLAYEISDRNGPEKTSEALEETRNYLENRQGLVGLHASFTLIDNTLEKARQIAVDYHTGIHVHLAEDKVDQTDCGQNYGQRVTERFANLGFLALKPSIFVHGIHLSENERSLFRRSDVHMAVNYDSNLNNKVGVFNGDGLGSNIMLGTDGMHSDMFASARTAWFTGMNHENIDPMAVYRRLRQVHHYLSHNNFRGDGENNLMVLDYDTPTPIHRGNFPGHFFYGMTSSHVKHLISRGKLILKDRKHTLLDETEIMARAREQAERLWARL
jgi:cytosine/adenosine deaminase-related metal-dependent hydrolase